MYFSRPDYAKEREKLKDIKAKRWNGNHFDEKSLKELAEIIKNTVADHGLTKL